MEAADAYPPPPDYVTSPKTTCPSLKNDLSLPNIFPI